MFAEHRPDVVVTDIKMPIMDGLEMASAIKASAEEIPIIVITAYSDRDYFIRAIDIGVEKYVTKPVNTELLLEAILRSARDRFRQRELERARQTVVVTLEQTVALLARAIEMRDPYTDGHQKRVAVLAEAIARNLGMSPEMVTGVRLASLIHDVGEIRIPAEILCSPRKLGAIEMDMIRNHARDGHDILAGADFPWPLARMVLEHHERMDGSGYPAGLKGDAICMEARIIAVAEVVEAMTSHRPHRPARGRDAAVAEIADNSGRLYDSEVVASCLRVLKDSGFDSWK